MTADPIETTIVNALYSVKPSLEGRQISLDTSLSDLAIDSLRLIELGARLEDTYGESTEFHRWLEAERAREGTAYTLGSLVQFVRDNQGS